MKLLNKNEIKDAKRTEMAKEVLLAQKVSKYVEANRNELNRLKEAPDKMREQMDAEFIVYETDMRIKRQMLENEVGTLEKRKETALKPIAHLFEEAKGFVEMNKQEAKELKKKGEELDITSAELDKYKRKVVKQEKDNETKDKTVENKIQSYIEDKESLTVRQNDFEEHRTKEESKLDKQKKELTQDVKKFDVEKKKVEIKEELFIEREEKIEKEWIKIKDQRATLERAFNRIKK